MLIPLENITDAAWGSLQRGADDPMHAMHLLTLATATPEGRPSARLMVNRGCDREAGRLWFHTDGGMPKVGEMRANPYASVVGWDREIGVQLRAFGRVVLHQHDAVSNRHWEQISTAARWLYSTVPEQAASEREPPDLRLPRDRRQLPHKLTAREREHFVVIELAVETIDWLQATQKEQRRAVMHRDSGWVAEVV
jgi:pyridoxamine 5'-phosphate oxidase